MSTKMISGWWSVILASASKPSSARITLQPACTRKISALRRIVFESSITITLTPARLVASLTPSTPKFPLSFTPTVLSDPLRAATLARRAQFPSDTIQQNPVKTKPCAFYFRSTIRVANTALALLRVALPSRNGQPVRLHFDHLEIFLPGPAFRASPIHRDVLPARPRRDSFLR